LFFFFFFSIFEEASSRGVMTRSMLQLQRLMMQRSSCVGGVCVSRCRSGYHSSTQSSSHSNLSSSSRRRRGGGGERERWRVCSHENERDEGMSRSRKEPEGYPEATQEELDELQEEFMKVVRQNFDGLKLELEGKDLEGMDTLKEGEAGEGMLDSSDDVTVWLQKDKPKRPKVEAKELFDWWNELDDVYVLIFASVNGDEDGIFTLKDPSSDEANQNFILAFEGLVEAHRYAKKLVPNLDGLEAEIECMGRDEILQLCKELEVGIRIVQEGGAEPEVPPLVQFCDVDEELDEIRRSLEDLLPEDDDFF